MGVLYHDTTKPSTTPVNTPQSSISEKLSNLATSAVSSIQVMLEKIGDFIESKSSNILLLQPVLSFFGVDAEKLKSSAGVYYKAKEMVENGMSVSSVQEALDLIDQTVEEDESNEYED